MLNNIKISIFFTYFINLTILAFVIVGTYLQSQYVVEPHHWGLMLSNAKDLINGLKPYKEIYIQYGILTTVIQGYAFWINNSLMSIMIITAITYGMTLCLIYFIANKVTQNKFIAFAAIITAYFYHPIVIHPWSNYIAGIFLFIGIYFAVNNNITIKNYFYSGLFLSLSVLSREGLFYPVIVILAVTIFLDFKDNKLKYIKLNIYKIIGFLIPIFIFITYLIISGNYDFWKIVSFDIPKAFTRYFPHVKTINAFTPLIKTTYYSVLLGEIRWIVTALYLTASLIYIFLYYLNYKQFKNKQILIISITSLLMTTSSIHIPEIFRLASGSVMGLVVLYYLLYKMRILFFIVFIIINYKLFITEFVPNSSNPYNNYPYTQEYSLYKNNLFKYQKWDVKTVNYYDEISSTFKAIGNLNCNYLYQYNDTMDNYLQILSPFTQKQLMPHAATDDFNILRPDLNYKELINEASNILILRSVDSANLVNVTPSPNFYIYRSIEIPNFIWLPKDHTLLFELPNKCMSIK
jgi:hypothetical protein